MHLINKSAVRHYVLERWQKVRPGHKMTRVAPETIIWAEATLRNQLDKMLQSHPSVGKTIRPD